jgi:sn-glycerol 3-phosphate transport system substrate-binding protein
VPTRRDALALASSLACFAGLDAFAGCGPREGGASLWFAYGGNNRKVLLSLVERFRAAHPDLALLATYQGDYFESLAKLRASLAAKAPPSLTHVIGEVLPYLAEAGVLTPLRESTLVNDGALSDLEPALAEVGTFQGRASADPVGLPFNRSIPVAYLNGDVLRELGLTAPRTWDELRRFALEATRREGGTVTRWGFSCPIDWWFWVALVGQAGGDVVAPSGAVTLGGEAGVEALSLWQRLVHDDGVMRPPPGRDYNAWQVTNTDFVSGRAAMIWSSTAFLRYLEDNARFPVVVAPLPRHRRSFVPTGGTFFVAPLGLASPSLEVVRAFLAFLLEPEQAAEWATRTGYLPVTRSARAKLEAEGYYAKHPNDAVALAALADAHPWPWAPTLFRAQREAVQPRLEAAIVRRLDPAALLTEARAALEGA